MNRSMPVFILLAFFSATGNAAAFDAKDYHAGKCTGCHNSTVYTRRNHSVKSYPQLQSRVAMCDANLGTKLFPEDMQSLTDHVNDNYYKFTK